MIYLYSISYFNFRININDIYFYLSIFIFFYLITYLKVNEYIFYSIIYLSFHFLLIYLIVNKCIQIYYSNQLHMMVDLQLLEKYQDYKNNDIPY